MDDVRDGFGSVEPASAMPGWYAELLGSVSQHVSTGRRRAVRAATKEADVLARGTRDPQPPDV